MNSVINSIHIFFIQLRSLSNNCNFIRYVLWKKLILVETTVKNDLQFAAAWVCLLMFSSATYMWVGLSKTICSCYGFIKGLIWYEHQDTPALIFCGWTVWLTTPCLGRIRLKIWKAKVCSIEQLAVANCRMLKQYPTERSTLLSVSAHHYLRCE